MNEAEQMPPLKRKDNKGIKPELQETDQNKEKINIIDILAEIDRLLENNDEYFKEFKAMITDEENKKVFKAIEAHDHEYLEFAVAVSKLKSE